MGSHDPCGVLSDAARGSHASAGSAELKLGRQPQFALDPNQAIPLLYNAQLFDYGEC